RYLRPCSRRYRLARQPRRSGHRAHMRSSRVRQRPRTRRAEAERSSSDPRTQRSPRSEEHTSELQSRENLVCRLLLEKKNTPREHPPPPTASPNSRRLRVDITISPFASSLSLMTSETGGRARTLTAPCEAKQYTRKNT